MKRIRRMDGSVKNFVQSWRYDAMNRVFETTLPDGLILDYVFDVGGRLESIPGVVDSVLYSPSGKADSIAYANGIATSFAYDDRTRLRGLQTSFHL